MESNPTERNDKGIKVIYVEYDKLLDKLGEFLDERERRERGGGFGTHTFMLLYVSLFLYFVTVLDDFN